MLQQFGAILEIVFKKFQHEESLPASRLANRSGSDYDILALDDRPGAPLWYSQARAVLFVDTFGQEAASRILELRRS